LTPGGTSWLGTYQGGVGRKGGFTGELKDLGEVKCSVEDKLKAVLNIRTVVELVARGGKFPGSWGKARR